MLEVTTHLLDQTWESSLVSTERPMLQHQRWWHLVSYTSLGALSWNQISPCSSSLNQMTMAYLMSSPCWSHHLGVFSREDWTCRAMSMSMLLVQSTYTGFDPISYHSQRWCFQWSDMVIENSLFRKYGWVVDIVIIWSICPRIGKCSDAIKEYHKSRPYSEDHIGRPYHELIWRCSSH
jgi:hypothetical protein